MASHAAASNAPNKTTSNRPLRDSAKMAARIMSGPATAPARAAGRSQRDPAITMA